MKTTLILFLVLAFAPFVFGRSVVVENHVSSSANTGGNSASGGSDGGNGGTVVTGRASARVDVKTETDDGGAVTNVEASATADGKTRHVSKEVTGSGVDVRVLASTTNDGAQGTTTIDVESKNADVEVTNVSISRTPAVETTSKVTVAVGEFISALKNFFSYVISIFKW